LGLFKRNYSEDIEAEESKIHRKEEFRNKHLYEIYEGKEKKKTSDKDKIAVISVLREGIYDTIPRLDTLKQQRRQTQAFQIHRRNVDGDKKK